jgi:hypothetical protein
MHRLPSPSSPDMNSCAASKPKKPMRKNQRLTSCAREAWSFPSPTGLSCKQPPSMETCIVAGPAPRRRPPHRSHCARHTTHARHQQSLSLTFQRIPGLTVETWKR